ncbi:MAG: hypothetical protein AAFY60_05045 [Myxococcota bacterium]
MSLYGTLDAHIHPTVHANHHKLLSLDCGSTDSVECRKAPVISIVIKTVITPDRFD